MKTLVIDTATAACSVALLENGALVARGHETVGRGHAERLLPMIAELPDGGRAQHILVDVGPGSFTGIRVGIAAARGLAFGWGASVAGYSSLALIAAAAFEDDNPPELAVVLEGGHGEVFMQGFAAPPTGPMVATDALVSLLPADALAALAGRPAYGSGTRWLAAIDSAVDAREALPDAARASSLPEAFVRLPPRPLYGRAPDAKIPAPRA